MLNKIFTPPSVGDGNPFEVVLSMLKSNESRERPWSEYIFKIGARAMATDGHALAYCEADLLDCQLLSIDDSQAARVLTVMKAPEGMARPIATAAIIAALERCPLEDKYNAIMCPACDGYGEVTAIYEHDGEDYNCKCPCPICDGDGYTDRILLDEQGFQDLHSIKIGTSAFAPHYMLKLVHIAKILDCEEINIVYQHPSNANSATVFKVGPVELLIMPVMMNEEYIKGEVNL